MRVFGFGALVGLLALSGVGSVVAAQPCDDCAAPAQAVPCQSYEMVEKTVMVPTWVTETRKVTVTEYKQEQRQRTYTVNKLVPETKQVTEEYTVMVPETRTRTEQYTVNKPVTRQVTQEYTVNVPHQETRQGTRRVCKYVPVTETRTINVPETRTRTEQYTVRKPVQKAVTQEYTVNVPHRETREGTRNVCRWVPVTEQRTVCEDQGHFEQVACAAPAPSCVTDDGCGPRGLFRRRCCSAPVCQPACTPACDTPCDQPVATRNVWVPNIVKKQVDVTVQKQQVSQEKYTYSVVVCKPETRTRTINVCDYVNETLSREVPYTVCVPKQQEVVVNKPQMVDVPYSYTVTVCKPEKRTRTVNVCEMVAEQLTREVPYTICVPQKKTRTRDVTTCRTVQEEKTCTYTVCVPYAVEREVQVRVCKLVPKKVQCRVPVAPACCDK